MLGGKTLLVPVSPQEQAPHSPLALPQAREPCSTGCILSAVRTAAPSSAPPSRGGGNWAWSEQRSLNKQRVYESKRGFLVLVLAAGHECRWPRQHKVLLRLPGTPS